MAELIAVVTTKGQVTIPAKIRQTLQIKPSDRVAFILEEDGVKLRPVSRSLLTGYGAVKPRQRPEDFAAIRRETQDWVAQQVSDELNTPQT